MADTAGVKENSNKTPALEDTHLAWGTQSAGPEFFGAIFRLVWGHSNY